MKPASQTISERKRSGKVFLMKIHLHYANSFGHAVLSLLTKIINNLPLQVFQLYSMLEKKALILLIPGSKL